MTDTTDTTDAVRILLIGATGNVGQEVVRTLSSISKKGDQEYEIIVGCRDVHSEKAISLRELSNIVSFVALDVLREDTYYPVISSNISSVFVCLPQAFSPDDMLLAHRVIANVCVKHQISHIVKVSSFGIDNTHSAISCLVSQGALGAAHLHGESLWREAGLQATTLRATSFSSNFESYDLASVMEHDRFSSPLGTESVSTSTIAKVNWVAVRDIGAAAAVVLTLGQDKYQGQVLDITGPANNTLSASEMSALLSRVRDRPISYIELDLPPEGPYRDLWIFLRAGGFNAHTNTLAEVLTIINMAPLSMTDIVTRAIKKYEETKGGMHASEQQQKLQHESVVQGTPPYYPYSGTQEDRDQINLICDGLYLTNYRGAENLEQLLSLGISSVVCVNGSSEDNPYPTQFQYLNVEGVDDEEDQAGALKSHFNATCAFIEENIEKKGGKVLVHCAAGISRSSTIVIYYLMITQQLNLRQAFDLVISCRRVIWPNMGFIRELLECERCLQQQQQQQQVGSITIEDYALWSAFDNKQYDMAKLVDRSNT